jgi:hypothetical protein
MPRHFTDKNNDIWSGGGFEVLFLYENVFDNDIKRISSFIWEQTLTPAPYLHNNIEEINQKGIALSSDFDLSSQLYGLTCLPNNNITNCYQFTVKDTDVNNKWWIYFGLPMGGLERFYKLGGYPFHSKFTDYSWIKELTDFLFKIGTNLYHNAPFMGAITGWLTLIEVDLLAQASKSLKPLESPRYNGYLIPVNNILYQYDPEIFEGIMK